MTNKTLEEQREETIEEIHDKWHSLLEGPLGLKGVCISFSKYLQYIRQPKKD